MIIHILFFTSIIASYHLIRHHIEKAVAKTQDLTKLDKIVLRLLTMVPLLIATIWALTTLHLEIIPTLQQQIGQTIKVGEKTITITSDLIYNIKTAIYITAITFPLATTPYIIKPTETSEKLLGQMLSWLALGPLLVLVLELLLEQLWLLMLLLWLVLVLKLEQGEEKKGKGEKAIMEEIRKRVRRGLLWLGLLVVGLLGLVLGLLGVELWLWLVLGLGLWLWLVLALVSLLGLWLWLVLGLVLGLGLWSWLWLLGLVLGLQLVFSLLRILAEY